MNNLPTLRAKKEWKARFRNVNIHIVNWNHVTPDNDFPSGKLELLYLYP